MSRVELTADFPMMTEGIDYAADAPAMFIADRVDLGCAGFQGALEQRVGIGDGENHANGAAAERFRAEVAVFGRLVAEPPGGRPLWLQRRI